MTDEKNLLRDYNYTKEGAVFNFFEILLKWKNKDGRNMDLLAVCYASTVHVRDKESVDI